jgi:hypothetical protein
MGGACSTDVRHEKCMQYFGWEVWREETTRVSWRWRFGRWSGSTRRVILEVLNNVSEEPAASIFRIEDRPQHVTSLCFIYRHFCLLYLTPHFLFSGKASYLVTTQKYKLQVNFIAGYAVPYRWVSAATLPRTPAIIRLDWTVILRGMEGGI